MSGEVRDSLKALNEQFDFYARTDPWIGSLQSCLDYNKLPPEVCYKSTIVALVEHKHALEKRLQDLLNGVPPAPIIIVTSEEKKQEIIESFG